MSNEDVQRVENHSHELQPEPLLICELEHCLDERAPPSDSFPRRFSLIFCHNWRKRFA